MTILKWILPIVRSLGKQFYFVGESTRLILNAFFSAMILETRNFCSSGINTLSFDLGGNDEIWSLAKIFCEYEYEYELNVYANTLSFEGFYFEPLSCSLIELRRKGVN